MNTAILIIVSILLFIEITRLIGLALMCMRRRAREANQEDEVIKELINVLKSEELATEKVAEFETKDHKAVVVKGQLKQNPKANAKSSVRG